jgi:hypothetical protein
MAGQHTISTALVGRCRTLCNLIAEMTAPRSALIIPAQGIVHAKLKPGGGFVPRPVNYILGFCEPCDALSSFKFPAQHFDAREGKP